MEIAAHRMRRREGQMFAQRVKVLNACMILNVLVESVRNLVQ